MKDPGWKWPSDKRIAVVFNTCLEAWSDGKAPGISPMGNPLPAGVLDTMAISWAAYGVRTGIYRLLEAFARHGAKTSVMVNAVVAERAPEAVKAIAAGGHEVLSHSYAMDVIPALLSDADERKNIERCTRLLEQASGRPVRGWLSPRGTSRPDTPRLLAEAGYRWYGDVFDADLPYVLSFGDKKLVAIPLSYDVNDMPSMKYGNTPKMMLESFDEVIDIARARSDELRIIDVTTHSHIFGHHRGAYYFEKIIEKAVAAPDIWIGTRAEIADHVLARSSAEAMSEVGRSVARLELRAKVTGRAPYMHHLRLPGMLHGKILRSTVPHGRIRRLDTAAAARLPGVYRVITAADVMTVMPAPFYGPAFHDQPVLVVDKVRHVGEPLAVVLAEDPHVAESALSLVAVEYDALDAVFDEVEAMRSPVIVHDALKPAGTFADLKHLAGRTGTNVALDYRLRRGDAAAALAGADHAFEHVFEYPPTLQAPLEPFISLAEPQVDAITIHTASQMPSFVRLEVARLLGWPENRVRVKVPLLGGGFGAKTYIKLEALVAALALIVRRPVKIAATMEEQFYIITNHATTFRIASGVSRDGKIVARSCDVHWNGGAYADIGPRIGQKSGFTAPGPYDIAHVRVDSYELYTNLVPAGAMRGFGIPQLVWAYESHTDVVARALGIDPIAFRRQNLLRDGQPQATGTIARDAAVEEVLDALERQMNWRAPFDRGDGVVSRGRGIAIGFKASVAPTASVAVVNIGADGSVVVSTSTVDMGQGSDTAMAQIAAEVLGVAAETVRIVHPDTDVTPFDMGTLGSRSTFHMGHAVRLAALDARVRLAALAAEAGLPAGSNVPLAEIFRRRYGMQAGNVIGSATYVPTYRSPDPHTGLSEDVTPFWMIGGTGVELEVDTETGEVRITRMVNVADCGTAINPQIVLSQLSGGAIMALGAALFEEVRFDAGQVTNASLADYKIPAFADVPPMHNELTGTVQRSGPFGAKGVGESSSFAVAPAVANAIDDAVGVRLTRLPLTAEAVLRAIRRKEGRPLAD